jgi:hypothetical protein
VRLFTTPVGDRPAVMLRISVREPGGMDVYRRIAEWTFPQGTVLRNGEQVLLEVMDSRKEYRPR